METFDLYQFFVGSENMDRNSTLLDNQSGLRWGIIEKLLLDPTQEIKINIYAFTNDNQSRHSNRQKSLELEAQGAVRWEFLQTGLSYISLLKKYENTCFSINELYESRELQQERIDYCKQALKWGGIRRALKLHSKKSLEKDKKDAEEKLDAAEKIKDFLSKIEHAPVNIQIVPEAQEIYNQIIELQVQADKYDFLDLDYQKVNELLFKTYRSKTKTL